MILMDEKPQVITEESVNDFKNYLSLMGRSSNTVRAYSSDVSAFLSAFDSFIEVTEFSDFALYWIRKSREVNAPRTVQRHMTSLKVFSKYLKIPNELDEYKLPEARAVNPHPLEEGISGVRRMIAAARCQDHQVIIALCGLAGLRVAESLAIDASDIDVHNKMLEVRGKGDKTRYVPISPQLWSVIRIAYFEAVLESENPHKPNMRLVSINDRAARKAISSIGRRAGLKRHVASHDLRATFATSVYNKTLDIKLVQELLGHSDVKTTMLYIGITVSAMRAGVIL